jgi:hypothetical protein
VNPISIHEIEEARRREEEKRTEPVQKEEGAIRKECQQRDEHSTIKRRPDEKSQTRFEGAL